jgi:hypothetical protein
VNVLPVLLFLTLCAVGPSGSLSAVTVGDLHEWQYPGSTVNGTAQVAGIKSMRCTTTDSLENTLTFFLTRLSAGDDMKTHVLNYAKEKNMALFGGPDFHILFTSTPNARTFLFVKRGETSMVAVSLTQDRDNSITGLLISKVEYAHK